MIIGFNMVRGEALVSGEGDKDIGSTVGESLLKIDAEQ